MYVKPWITGCCIVSAALLLGAQGSYPPAPVERVPAPQSPLQPTVPAPPPAAAPEEAVIQLDDDCRIYNDPATQSPLRKPLRAPAFCEVSEPKYTERREQDYVAGSFVWRAITIRERNYHLHNALNEPVAFLIEQTLPKGWQIDSDPQPVYVDHQIATFRVLAEPGQTVNLHIGARIMR